MYELVQVGGTPSRETLRVDCVLVPKSESEFDSTGVEAAESEPFLDLQG